MLEPMRVSARKTEQTTYRHTFGATWPGSMWTCYGIASHGRKVPLGGHGTGNEAPESRQSTQKVSET